MKFVLWTVCLFVGVCAVTFGAAAEAQPRTGEIVLANSGGLHGNALIAMGRYGVISTIMPLPEGAIGGLDMNQGNNEDLVVVGCMVLGINDGVVRTLVGRMCLPVTDVALHEDCTWVMPAGTDLLGLNPIRGVRSTVATGFKQATRLTWNGADGTMVVIDAGDGGAIYSVAMDGTKRRIATVPGATCITWDAFTGNFFVAAPNVLYGLTQTGRLTTLESGKPGLKNPTGMFLRSDCTLLVVQGNTTPTGVYAYHGRTGRYNRPYHEDPSAEKGINPVGVIVEHYREMWPMQTTSRIGESLRFKLNFAHQKGLPYVAGMSFGHAPGIRLGNYCLHLNLDPLLLYSLTAPSMFQNCGTTGKHGTACVVLHVPEAETLVGLRIFLGAVVLNPICKDGIGEASATLGVTLQPK